MHSYFVVVNTQMNADKLTLSKPQTISNVSGYIITLNVQDFASIANSSLKIGTFFVCDENWNDLM